MSLVELADTDTVDDPAGYQRATLLLAERIAAPAAAALANARANRQAVQLSCSKRKGSSWSSMGRTMANQVEPGPTRRDIQRPAVPATGQESGDGPAVRE